MNQESMNYFNAKIGIIGTGNIARNLSNALYEAGFTISSIYSRKPKNAEDLAKKLSTTVRNLNGSMLSDNILIFCVPDTALSELGKSLKIDPDTICIHTSGGMPVSVFPSNEAAVLWPLQSYSAGDNDSLSDFRKNPVFIEASGKRAYNAVRFIAGHISENIVETTLEKRVLAHIAAVFACNFVNHMYACSESLCKKEDIDFGLLLPIIEKTSNRIRMRSPFDTQTGPAFRKDIITIERHLDILSASPGLKELYSSVTNSIFAMYKKTGNG